MNVETLVTSPEPLAREAAYDSLDRELASGAAVRSDGSQVAAALLGALIAGTAKDPVLAARLLARLTLGHVAWLEVNGADDVGTSCRAVLLGRRADVTALVASSSAEARGAGIWLMTLAGWYDALPPLGDRAPADLPLLLAHAHARRADLRKRRGRRLTKDDPCTNFRDECHAWFLDPKRDRAERLVAAVAWYIATSGSESFIEIDGHVEHFLRSVPRDASVPGLVFAGGRASELVEEVLHHTYCTPWSREQVTAPEDFEWDRRSSAGAVEDEQPAGAGAPAGEPLDAEETNPYMLGRPSARGEALVELRGLDAVDWRSLEDAYGHAGGTPVYLRALASSDAEERDWGFGALIASINHQGGTTDASVAALPFLVELACDARVLGRRNILRLLIGLATGEPEWALLETRHPTLCTERFAEYAGRLAVLAGDPDPNIRTHGVHLLGHLEGAAAVVTEALAARLELEEDPYLRANIAMASARVNRGAPSVELAAKAARMIATVERESSLASAVAAFAPFYLQRTLDTDQRARIAAVSALGAVVHPSYAWNDGDVGGHARLVHRATMTATEALDAVLAGEIDQRMAAHDLLFPEATWRGDDLYLPEELTDAQMRYLRFATTLEQAFYDPRWRDAGLPMTAAWLRRFTSTDPSGPLDRRVSVKRDERAVEWPLWKVLHALGAGSLLERDWSEIAEHLGDVELLEIVDDLQNYRLESIRAEVNYGKDGSLERSERYRDEFYLRFLAPLASRPGVVDVFRSRAETILTEESNKSSCVERSLAFAVLGLAATKRGDELAARYAALTPVRDWSPAMTYTGVLRAGLAALDPDGRSAWFEGVRLLSLTLVEDARGVRHRVRVHDGWEFLDLVSTPSGEHAALEALTMLGEHAAGTADTSEHSLGLTKGPIITWDSDEAIAPELLARIAAAWGDRWDALLRELEPRVPASILTMLRDAAEKALPSGR